MLSVLINTCNRPDRLERCLRGLAIQDPAPAEVVVVDDGGVADLLGIIKGYEGPAPVVFERIEHAGRAAARNRALELARGERVLFLGDDVIAKPGLLVRHGACGDPGIAVVGPYPLVWRGGSAALRRWAEPNPQERIEDRQNAGAFFFATGNLSADRNALLELGGFDPRFKLYGWEDIDLGLRFERSGGRIVFDPEAQAAHDHGHIGRRQLWEREREMGFTAYQFAEKWKELEPEFVHRMKFWGEPRNLPDRAGRVRRMMGNWGIALLDRVAPDSSLNAALYERMVFSQRLEGVAEAQRVSGARPGA